MKETNETHEKTSFFSNKFTKYFIISALIVVLLIGIVVKMGINSLPSILYIISNILFVISILILIIRSIYYSSHTNDNFYGRKIHQKNADAYRINKKLKITSKVLFGIAMLFYILHIFI